MLTKKTLIDAPVLGFLLWLIGYLAGIVLYFFVPVDLIGWIMFVIFTPIVILICYKRFKKRSEKISYYAFVAAIWLVIAVAFDYIFLVSLLNAPNYYKLDVYVYYACTFLIPFLIGWKVGTKR
jgi:hypothetical protein